MAISRNRRFVLGILIVLAIAGCGSRPASTPIAPSTPWVESLLGSASHFSLVVRPASFMRDPYWGPATHRALAKPKRRDDPDDLPDAQIASLFGAAQLELFVGVRDFGRLAGTPRDQIGTETLGYVYVVRGMAGADPAVLTTKRGDRHFMPPVRLASGALEYPPSPSFVRRSKGLATWLYVMPDGTWVGVDQVTAQRARGVYAQTGAPPPPAALESEGLFAAFVDRYFLDAATKRAEARDATWRRDLTGAGLVLHGGRNGAVEVVLDYANDGAAERAKDWSESTLTATCRQHELACVVVKMAVRDVKLAQDGRRFGITFFLSELLLQKLAEG